MMNWQKQSLVVSISCSLAIAGGQAGGMSAAAQSAASPPAVVTQPAVGLRFDAAQLDQLVAPIALYPDALVAQMKRTSLSGQLRRISFTLPLCLMETYMPRGRRKM